MLSMNVFQQPSRPNLLYFPSSSASASFHGRRRISTHNPPLLVSFPATKMGINPKSLNLVHGVQHSSCRPVLASPATMGFHHKSLNLVHGVQHSFCKPVLASPATMKLSPVLFALPRDNEEFSSDNEEVPKIQEHEEHSTSTSSDNVHEKQSKKVSIGEVKKLEFEVREATTDEEFWGSALLRVEAGFAEDLSRGCDGGRNKKELVEKEYIGILGRYMLRSEDPYMCIIAVRKEGENVLTGIPENVIGTLDFYDIEENQCINKSLTEREVLKYGRITNVTTAEIARQQGVGSRMLKFVIKHARKNGTPQLFVYPRRDNKSALALYEKNGFVRQKTTPYLDELNVYQYRIIL